MGQTAKRLLVQASVSPESHARDPAEWAMLASRGRWVPAPHLMILNDYLMSLVEGDIDRLIVVMPPRHGKSEFCSRYFPAWYLGQNPDHRVILLSYESEFAREWGRKVRDELEEWGPELFSLRVRGESRAADRWEIEGREGGMRTAGILAGVTGKGAHILIIDDPVKDAAEAASRLKRDRTWEQYLSTAYSRLEPGAKIIVIQTRWHEDDLSGRLVSHASESGEEWTVLHLPAISTGREKFPRRLTKRKLRQKPDEPLWPERYGLKALQRIRSVQGPYWWNALYQGSPIPAGGSIFKREHFRYFTVKRLAADHEIAADFVQAVRKEIGWAEKVSGKPEVLRLKPGTEDWDRTVLELAEPDGTVKRYWVNDCWWAQTVDTAMKKGQSNDYTVCSTFAVTPDWNICVFDIARDRLELPDQFPFLMNNRRAHPYCHFTAIEEAQFGAGLVAMAKREGITFQAFRPKGDKETRATAIATYYNTGAVYHRSGPRPSWSDDFEDEMVKFPSGEHDDQVDTMSMIGLIVLERASKHWRIRTFDENLTPVEKRALEESATRVRGF